MAISWVQRRPGVASSIIGARTLKQLEDNVAALEVKLKPQHEERLNALTAPALDFPHDFVTVFRQVLFEWNHHQRCDCGSQSIGTNRRERSLLTEARAPGTDQFEQ